MKFIISSTALFALAAMPALAQQVPGVTPTQAVIHYQAPNAADCQVKVSTNSSMAPLAHDVDPVLFPGSNLDSRPGNVISPSKTDRYFVVGQKRADVASDGKRYSRALQAFTEYFYQVSCSGNVQTGRFVTANLPLGNDYPEPPPFDATAFGNWAWPTIDWNDQSRTYIDPMTGVLFKRATAPGWFGQMQSGITFNAALDLNAISGIASGWTNVSNIFSGNASTKASYTGAGGDPIFLAFDPATLLGYGNKQFAGWGPDSQTLDNILLRVFGTGSGTVSACLSDDSGGHCASPAVNVVDLHSGGGNPAGTFPAACASDSDAGCFPNNGFWGGWNFVPRRGQMSGYSGTVNIAGSTVTAASGTKFDLNWKPGGKISIAGTAPACPNNLCTISLVNSSSSLTIVEFAPSVSNAAFKTANTGVMVWINKAGSTYAASISVNFDYAYSDQVTMPATGSTGQCSPHPTTVSYAADGVTPITPVAGELCLSAHNNGPTQFLYLLIPSTGETRFLSPLAFANPSDPVPDQVTGFKGLPNAFDSSDPNTFYVQANTTGGTAIFSGTYNAAVYKYRAYAHSLYPPARYNPGQDVTRAPYQDPAWADTGITWVNLTKASQGKDIGSQIAATDPNWDPTIFRAGTVTRVADGKAFVTNAPINFGETIGLVHAVDLATGSLYASATTYSTFPARWCAMHSDFIVDGWYGLLCNPLGGASAWQGNSSLIGVGPWQMTPTAVLKNGIFSSDTSLTATSPMDACPTIPAFLAPFVPANPVCVTFQSPMACSHTPNAAEKLKWPCETNPAWSEIQQIAPGDGLAVVNGHAASETLLVISVTSSGSGSYQFTAVRGTAAKGAQAAPSGWTAYAVPPETDCNTISTCTGGAPGFWYKLSDPTFTWRADPGVFAGHSDLGQGPKAGTNTYCYTGVCRYNVPFEQQINDQFKTAKKLQDGSFAGVSGAVAMQGYPSLHQVNAPLTEQVWMANYRHLNPSFGAGPEVPSAVGAVSYSLVPGTTGVYKFTSVNGGLHYKQVPVVAYAGYHLLKEVSSPARGNIITDATPWQYCVVFTAGECRTGSAAGEVYMSVPQGLVAAGPQNCIANWYDDNYPCVFSPPAKAGFMVQEGTSKDDPNGTNWRRISMGFSGYGRQFEFGSFIPDPTGTWGFSEGYWLDGVRNDLLIAKLPPWPNPQDVTVNRTNFINQSVQIGAGQNLTSARVRFGYTENGNVTDFFCTARQESCVTAGTASTPTSPYWFIGENQGWQQCTNGCTVSVPAIPGRVLFYAVDRQDGAGNTIPGTTQVAVVR